MTPTQYMRLFRARRVAAGLCADCGDHPFVPGYTRCQGCRHKKTVKAVALRLARRAEERCLRCAAPAQGQFCDEHRAERREVEGKVRARKRAPENNP